MSTDQFSILEINRDFIVLNKPSGISVIPERFSPTPCFREIVEAYLDKRVYLVHRLDKETSGLILFALTSSAQRELCMQFERHLVEKFYLSMVYGNVSRIAWTCEMPIGVGRKGKMKIGGEKSKHAKTDFFKVGLSEKNLSIVIARPITGRRHQIRLHLACSGHPIVGDKMYMACARVLGGFSGKVEQTGQTLCLHSYAIRFLSPETKQPVFIRTKLPSWCPKLPLLEETIAKILGDV